MTHGKLISHFSHPQHELNWETSEQIFKCDGCCQVGTGSRFRCSLCDFDLHIACAAASPSGAALRHPFYPKCLFDFFPLPPGGSPRYCKACGQGLAGFVYHCRKYDYDLHPCCAALPLLLNPNDGLRLHLHNRMSAPCNSCERKDKKSWCYRSDCKNYTFHVACMKEMLLDNCQMVIRSGNKMPVFRAAGNGHHRSWKGKVKSCCKILAMLAVRFVMGAVLGDPTAPFAGIDDVYSLLFK